MELLIYDGEDFQIDTPKDLILLWSDFNDNPSKSTISIPRYIESNPEFFRNKYLKYIYKLGKKKFNGKTVAEIMQIRKDLSFWWLTLLVEKCNYSKSKQIANAVKMFAFESIIDHRVVKKIDLISNNNELAQVFNDWCKKNGAKFTCKPLSSIKAKQEKLWRKIYSLLPYFLKAILWFLYRLYSRWPLKNVGNEQWKISDANTTFVSYFFNLDDKSIIKKKYKSAYWADLPNEISKKKIKTRWIHLWVESGLVSTARKARKILNELNKDSLSMQSHVFLESFYSFGTIARTLWDWIILCIHVRKLNHKLAITNENEINLLPLLEKDWKMSIFGPDGIHNLLILNLFESAFANLPKQKKGIYLQENQSWELSLVYVWKFYENMEIIGCPHSTIRFWDLRYFNDPEIYKDTKKFAMPMPNFVAVNSQVAKEMLVQNGYPVDRIKSVEALRYLHLLNYPIKRDTIKKNKKLLVLTDYSYENTSLQMNFLEKAAEYIMEWEICIKPHPACFVKISDYPNLTKANVMVSTKPLEKLIPHFRVAFTSSVTSAAVEAYVSGLFIISILNPNTQNFSPLKNTTDVKFVSKPEEFSSALKSNYSILEKNVYFKLDNKLTSWKKLLNIKNGS